MVAYTSFTTLTNPLANTGTTSTLPSFVGFLGDGTMAAGFNATGQIVGFYYASSDGSPHGFLYNGTTYTTFDDPLAFHDTSKGSYGLSINDAGQIVGVYNDSTGVTHAFIDNGGTFTTLNAPGGGGVALGPWVSTTQAKSLGSLSTATQASRTASLTVAAPTPLSTIR